MPRGNPAAVALGPGYLYLAILGSTEPVNTVTGGIFSDAWAAAWVPLGYTEEGSTQSYSPEYEDVVVAEELDPIDSIATSRSISVSFGAAENTALNYKRAMNGGTITVSGTAPAEVFKFEPPDLGSETLTMIGFESEDHQERWVWRQAKQVGSAETARRKGAEKALIPMEFRVFVPDAGGKPFTRWSCRPGEAVS